jgi:peptidoglycan/LPS O-acetylase OafA/YrhL
MMVIKYIVPLVIAIILSVKFNDLFPSSAVIKGFVRKLGLMTYPFYLLHERVDPFVIYQLNRAGLPPLLCALAEILCTGVLALLIASYCEPALRNLLKTKFRVLSSAPKQLVSQVS